jgi:hypothetical protein
MRTLDEIYPGTVAWAMLGAKGETLHEENIAGATGGGGGAAAARWPLRGLAGAVRQVVAASNAFGASLVDHDEVEMTHVHATRAMVTAARVGASLMVVFVTLASTGDGETLADKDLSAQDQRLRLLCEDVAQLMASVQVAGKSRRASVPLPPPPLSSSSFSSVAAPGAAHSPSVSSPAPSIRSPRPLPVRQPPPPPSK